MRIGAPFLSILAILFVLSLFMTSSAYNVTPSTTLSLNQTASSSAQSVKTYDVTLSASPKNQTVDNYQQGERVAIYINSTNSGSANFNVTGCVLQYLNSTGQWHGLTCTGKAFYDPFVIAAHTTNSNFNLGIDFGTSPATYNFRFWWTGTVNGVAGYKSKLCTFTVVID